MKRMDFGGKWVLVTGASSGLGREIAKDLAIRHRAHIIPVARRAERLEELATELREQAGVEVRPLVADLARPEDVDRVCKEATEGAPLYAAVLNAGITHFGDYRELSLEGLDQMLALNVSSVVRMTHRLLPYLEEQNTGGGILLVSSMAGMVPSAYQTAYSATKAFLMNLGGGLHHELDGKNVSVTTYLPGGIATEMTAGKRFEAQAAWMMSPERAARSAVDGFARRRYFHVPGFVYNAGVFLTRLLPRRFFAGRVAASYRKALRAAGEDA